MNRGESVTALDVREMARLAASTRPRGWRKGQAVFNALAQLFPHAAEPLRGGPLDCFHRDERIEAFICEVERRHAEAKWRSE